MNTILITLFIILNVLDWHSTKKFLAVGVEEANPLLRWTINKWGVAGLARAKILIITPTCAALYIANLPIFTALMCAIYLFVVVRNYRLA